MSRKPELKGRAARLARLLPAGAAHAARTPFVLLVVLLLGGGLIGLLVLNSALSEGSFHLDDLQKGTKSLTDEEQALQRDVDAYSAPDALQRRARELGMVPGGDPAFLAPDGTVKGVPGAAARDSSLRNPATRPPEVLGSSPTASRTPATGTPVTPAAGPSATGAPATGTPVPAVTTPAAGTPSASVTSRTRSLASVPTPTPTPTPSTQRSSTPGR
ncbi:septum formation initiator family protein [Streptomyces fagopyri]|uniref:septum formation initiator family protein n=1 Tax=Streptomyces fagopyri TaxID=2662397 RepID=UPI001885A9D7|nr:septum formation initiator family protein [Streptomyces fagopyri]